MDPYKLILEALAQGKRGTDLIAVAKSDALKAEGVTCELVTDPFKGEFHYVADTGPNAGKEGDRSGRIACHVIDHPGSLTRLIVCVEDGWYRRVGKKVQ